jgi:FkbM family methyltransferase
MLEPVLYENQDGRFYVLPNDVLGQHLARGERWEPHFTDLVSALLRPGDFVADVGANIGYNSVVMAKLVGPNGQVHAFEPLRITFQQMCGNFFLNRLSNVYAHHCALGPVNDVTVSMIKVDYTEPNVNLMNTCIGIGGELVQMRTLDSFPFASLALLKIDVQGAELVALRGAENTVKKHRPVLFIEIEEPQLKNLGTTSSEVMMQVFSMNYNLVWFGERAMFDWVAVPVEAADRLAQVVEIMGPESQVFRVPI